MACNTASAWYWQNEALFIRLHVQANAKKSQWAGVYGDNLKLKLHAPAIDGKANQALIQFIAGYFEIAKSKISVVSGQLNRNKLLKITGNIEIKKLTALAI